MAHKKKFGQSPRGRQRSPGSAVGSQRGGQREWKIQKEPKGQLTDADIVAFEAIPAAVAITRLRDNKIVYANRRVEELLGFPREQLLSMETRDFYYDLGDRERLFAQFEKDGRVRNFEARLMRPDKRVIWVSVSMENFVFAGENCLLVIVSDVHERKEAELERLLSEQQLHQAEVLTKTGSYTRNLLTGEVKWSPNIYKIWGFEADLKPDIGLIKKSIHPDDLQRVTLAMQNAVEKGTEVTGFEYRIFTPEGQLKYIRVNSRLMHWGGFSAPMLLGTVQDISEEKAQKTELAQKAQLLDAVGQAIFAADNDDRIIYWNRAAVSLFGWQAGEVIGKKILEVLQPEPDSRALRERRERAAAGAPFSNQVVCRHRSGKTLILKATGTPVLDENGKQIGRIGVSEDISQQRADEENILFQAQLLNAVDEAIIATDLKHNITYWNNAAENLLGWSSEEVIGTSFDAIFPELASVLKKAVIAQQPKSRRLSGHEYRCRNRNGREFPVLIESYVVLNRQQQHHGSVNIVRDLTEKKEKEKELTKRENDLKETQSFARLGRWELDLVTNRLHWSDTIFEIFEIDPEKFGASYDAFLDAIHPDDRAMVNEAYISSLESRKSYEIEHRLLMKDGRVKWVTEACRTIYDENGIAVYSVGIVQEITKRKIIEESLMKATLRSRDLERAINSHSLVAITDGTGVITYANEKCAQVTGYTADEMIGKTHRIINSGYHSREFFRDMWATIKAGNIWQGELVNRRKNGQLYWTDTTIVPFLDADNKPYQYIAVRADITQRVQSQSKLAETERFRMLFEQAAVGVVLIDGRSGKFIRTNSRFCEMLNFPPHEILTRDFRSILHPDDLADTQRKITELSDGKAEILSLEKRCMRKDNGIIWVSITASRITENDGQSTLVVFVQDISKQKEAEAQNLATQVQLKATIAAIPDLMFEVDTDGVYHSVWAPHSDLLAAPEEQLRGKKITDVLPAQAATICMSALKEAEAAGESHGMQFVLKVPLGLRWFELSIARKATNSEGKSRFIVLSRDITNRKISEQAIIESEERWSYALEATSDGVWDWNITTGQVKFSQNWQKLLGYQPEEIGNNIVEWEKHIYPEDLDRSNAEVMDYLEGRKADYRSEQRLLCKDGTVKWILDRGMVVHRDDSGRPTRMIGTITDITTQKLNEQHIRDLNENLEKLVEERTVQLNITNKELEAFSYSVSHDLRSPLRGIDGWSQALVEDFGHLLEARASEYLGRIRFEVARMAQLIDGLLRLARVSRSGLKLQPIDLSEIARKIAVRLQSEYPNTSIQFEILPGLIAHCDAELMEIALTNLLSNSVKFSVKSQPPRIEFGATTINHRKTFFVRDNGVGFDMNYAGKLFGAFQRLHKAPEYPGTGIGLATVQRIIRSHHGEIWADSTLNLGSTFYFILGDTEW